MSRPISAAYLERKLRALSGLTGGNPLPTLTELQGLITLESDRPEWRLPGGDHLVVWAGQVASSIGEFSYVGVRNPIDSGVIAIVEETRTIPTAASGATNGVRPFYERLPAGTPPDNVSQSTLRDLRATKGLLGNGLPTGATQVVSGADPTQGWASGASLGAWLLAGHPGNGPGDVLSQPYIVPPGTQVVWFGDVVTNTIGVSMWGYERPIEGLFDIR